MPKKQWTDDERKAFGQKMKERKAAKQNQNTSDTPKETNQPNTETVTIQQDKLDAILDRLAQLENTPTVNQHLKGPETVQLGNLGQTVGVITKYPIDSSYYPNPLEELYGLNNLRRFSMRDNWELRWDVEGQVYETKFGTNIQEPFFSLTLIRRDFDEEGNEKPQGFVYGVLKFNEDETLAYQIAQELGINVRMAELREIMNLARYERMKQWLTEKLIPPKIPPLSDNSGEKVDPITGRAMRITNTQQLV